MAHCFKNENIKTAKDYIDSKKYDSFFCNYFNKEIWDNNNNNSIFKNNKPTKNFNQKKNIALIKEENIVEKANNHTNFLYLKKAKHQKLIEVNKNNIDSSKSELSKNKIKVLEKKDKIKLDNHKKKNIDNLSYKAYALKDPAPVYTNEMKYNGYLNYQIKDIGGSFGTKDKIFNDICFKLH
jgi:hypothetical protein